MKIGTVAVVTVLIVAVVAGGLVWRARQTEEGTPPSSAASLTKRAPTGAKLPPPKKVPHFETSTPAHGAVLAGGPINVAIDVNFDLRTPSSISVTRDGVEFTTGETVIDPNQLTMRRAVQPDAPDGTYRVTYQACWPDKSCHDGSFSFVIDRSQANAYTDLTNQSAVTVHLNDVQFNPMKLRVSRGTTISWVNDDPIEHFVNADQHPAHSYHLAQNSRGLKQGDTYTVTFDTAGLYPYHCSAHASTMAGSILVE